MTDRPYHKILWSEGMLVGPHHFQQADRYQEAVLDFRLRPLVPFGWGVFELGINQELLENGGLFQLEHFRGVLPSGTIVDIPRGDEIPSSREVLSHYFEAPSNRLAVYLALPTEQRDHPNIQTPDGNRYGGETRYLTEFVEIYDESGRDNVQEIVTIMKNVKLLFGNEPSHNLERLKIAELMRHGDGRITLVDGYIPASLLIAAAPQLLKLLQNLSAELLTQSTMLGAALTQRTAEQYTLKGATPEALWALNLLNGAMPILNHLCHIQHVHPEVVFRHLASLAGQLSTLSPQITVTDLPLYDHENIGETFTLLDHVIRRLLNLVAKPISKAYRSYEMIPATTPRGYAVLRTQYQIDSALLTSAHQYYLVIRAEAIEARRQGELLQILPNTLTIAGMPAIDEFIEFAYGVYVTATPPPSSNRPQLPVHQLSGPTIPPPPDDVPTESGAIYCALVQEGPAWQTVQTTQLLAVHMPPEFRREFKTLDIELIITENTPHV